MQIYYITLFYHSNETSERPVRPEFHIGGSSFSEASSNARKKMYTEYPSEIDDKLFITTMGWELPGATAEKRLS
jgi:hypothetical protein